MLADFVVRKRIVILLEYFASPKKMELAHRNTKLVLNLLLYRTDSLIGHIRSTLGNDLALLPCFSMAVIGILRPNCVRNAQLHCIRAMRRVW